MLILAIQNPAILDEYNIKPEMFDVALYRSTIEQLGEFARQGVEVINFRQLILSMELPEVASQPLLEIYKEAKNEFNIEGASQKNIDFFRDNFFEMTRQRLADKAVGRYMQQDMNREELKVELDRIDELGVRRGLEDSKWFDEAIRDKFEELASEKIKKIFALTGFRELDSYSKLISGTLNVIAARPSVGKTAFILNLAKNFSNLKNATIDFFSGETKTSSLMDRVLAMETRVPAKKFREGELSTDDFIRFSNVAGVIEKRNTCITQMTNKTVYDIRKRVKQSKKERPAELHVVIIDHLGLIKKHTKESRHDLDIGQITRYLKEMAIEEDVVVILLSQLSRAVEQREDKRPRLSDLRDSGNIEQDADDVWFLYRDDYYNKESESANLIEVAIAKAREGQLGTVKLFFDKEIQKIAELEYA